MDGIFNILLSDTDKDFLKAISLLFQNRKIRLTECENAFNTLETLKKDRYDLIISETDEPGFLRQVGYLQPHAKKILLTSNEEAAARNGALEAGFELIRQPLTEQDIEKLGKAYFPPSLASQASQRDRIKQKADSVIVSHSLWAAGIGLFPVPLIDLVGLSAIQLHMLKKIAGIYGIPFSKDKGKHLIASLAGAGIPVMSADSVSSFVRLVPLVGQSVGVLSMTFMSGLTTYTVGRLFVRHFESGGTLDIAGNIRRFGKKQNLLTG